MATPNKPKTNWIDLLQEANVGLPDKIPNGFKPMEKWLEEFEISETTWKRRIPILEKKGVIVRGYYKAAARDGRLLKKPFWKRKSR